MISRRTIVPSERPLVRRTTSPTRNPKVLTWYPCAVPGSHHGAWAAHAAHMASQSKTASSGSGPAHGWQTGLMAEQLPHRDPGLILRSELGPYPDHRIVKEEPALPDQAGHTQGGHRLPDGEDVAPGFPAPTAGGDRRPASHPTGPPRPSRPPRCTPRPLTSPRLEKFSTKASRTAANPGRTVPPRGTARWGVTP